MARSFSISSSRLRLGRLPWAGLLALVLVVATDRLVLGVHGPWSRLVVDDPNGAAATRVDLHALRAAPPGTPRVVVVGTSQVIDGIDLQRAQRRLPGVAFAKLGHPRFEPFVIRALAPDLVAAGADAVVLIGSALDTHRPLRLEPIPGSSAASLTALWDLLTVTDIGFVVRNRTSLYRLVGTSLFLAYRYRFDLRLAGLDEWRRFPVDARLGRPADARRSPFRPVALWGARHHRVAEAAVRTTFDVFPPRLDAREARIQAGTVQETTRGPHVPVQMHLYRRAIQVLREAGVAVVLVEGGLHPAGRDLFDGALRSEFLTFADQLVEQSGIRFVPLDKMPRLAESDYYDLIHTNASGAEKMTDGMLRGLRGTGIDWGGSSK